MVLVQVVVQVLQQFNGQNKRIRSVRYNGLITNGFMRYIHYCYAIATTTTATAATAATLSVRPQLLVVLPLPLYSTLRIHYSMHHRT
jgi:hypothetical protein